MFKTGVLRGLLGPKRQKVKENGSNTTVEWAAL
jgi:hypothetical protein